MIPLTVSTSGGFEAFAMATCLWTITLATARIRMSSTMIDLDGIVNPNSRLYLRK